MTSMNDLSTTRMNTADSGAKGMAATDAGAKRMTREELSELFNGHIRFIPAKEFRVHHLPSRYRHPDIYDVIRAQIDVTVKIVVKGVSADRPEFGPGTTIPYPGYSSRGKNATLNGTGKVWGAIKYTEGMEDYRTCPCQICVKSGTPRKLWWQIEVMTASHVVFDVHEAEHCVCTLWFDDDKSHKVEIRGWKLGWSYDDLDASGVFCASHDLELGEKIKGMVERFESLCKKLQDKYKSRRNIDRLTVIVSHPHGGGKKVTLGQWIHRQNVLVDWARYTYTNHTCLGSSGLPSTSWGLGGRSTPTVGLK